MHENIDRAAEVLFDCLQEAVEEENGELAAIFGGSLAVFLRATAPGYTERQSTWWNECVALLRLGWATAQEHGYPRWADRSVEQMAQFAEYLGENANKEWASASNS